MDSGTLLDEAKDAEPSQPKPDHEETVFLDSSDMLAQTIEAELPPPKPDHEETAFFDSRTLLDGAQGEGLGALERKEDADDESPPEEEG